MRSEAVCTAAPEELFSLDLEQSLRELLGQIPRGRVVTYGDLARCLGAPVAARWVGHYALNHPHDRSCPCHRIVRSDGSLGNYIEGAEIKPLRLRGEGISVAGGRIDLPRHQFAGLISQRPLERLLAFQLNLTQHVRTDRLDGTLRRVGGVDVSYGDDKLAAAALTICDATTAELLWSTCVLREVRFPYISTLLSFRELPLLTAAVHAAQEKGQLPDVLLVDGSGIMHPRRAGIASHLGVVTGLPTVGVTKTKLVGHVAPGRLDRGAATPVTLDGQPIGWALGVSRTGKRAIYVSPGHHCDVAGSVEVVRRVLRGRRLPEPLYWADRISREAVRPICQRPRNPGKVGN